MDIREIMIEIDRLKDENLRLRHDNEEIILQKKILENKLKKIRVLLDTQYAIVNYN
tara:strand:+ start:339 stop:506 length:168 start_codon:yes stop_codon:yes gene_type:complete